MAEHPSGHLSGLRYRSQSSQAQGKTEIPLSSPALGKLPTHLTTDPEEALHVGKTSLAGPGQGAAVGTQVKANNQ